MTAVTDLITVLTILKGSAPTNPQIAKVADLYMEYLSPDAVTPTNEDRAQAVLTGMRSQIRKRLRAIGEQEVYSTVLSQPHLPSEQQAIMAALQDEAIAAGDAAEQAL